MKVAFDEHIPKHVAKALKELSGEERLLQVKIYEARRYAVPKAVSDVPWLVKFARAGGKVVVSGDGKMRGKLHEQKALSDAGFIVFFLGRQWNNMRGHDKCAMIIRWWPFILKQMHAATPGQFFEIPMTWNPCGFKVVTPPSSEQLCAKRDSVTMPNAMRAFGRRETSVVTHVGQEPPGADGAP